MASREPVLRGPPRDLHEKLPIWLARPSAYLVDILLPVADNEGQRIDARKYDKQDLGCPDEGTFRAEKAHSEVGLA